MIDSRFPNGPHRRRGATGESEISSAQRERRDYQSDAGDTLIEILITITILGLAIVSLMGAFLTVVGSSARHRSYAAADTILKNFADAAIYSIQMNSPALFTPCGALSGTASSGTTSTYISYGTSGGGSTNIPYLPPTGYTVTVTDNLYLVNDNTPFQSGPSNCTGQGGASYYWPQEFTVTATGPKGASSSLSFVVVDPAKAETNYQPPTPTTTTTTTTATTTTTTTTTTTVPPTTTIATTTTTIAKHDKATLATNVQNNRGGSWTISSSVTVVDSTTQAALSGATVQVDWTATTEGHNPTVISGSSTCVTVSTGSCNLTDINLANNYASATLTASSVTLPGYTYVGGTPVTVNN